MRNHISKISILLLLLALVPACTKSNAVKLTYALGQPTVACKGEVVVFKFQDKRTTTKLGKDSDGAVIDTLSNVSDWIGWALFDELKSAGCDPKYRTSTIAPGDALFVTGEVLDVSLDQVKMATYRGRVTVRVMMEKAGKLIHSEKFTSEVENVDLPGYGTRSEIMAETLRTLMGEIVPTVCKKM